MARIKPGTPTAGTVPAPAIEHRDLLDDLGQVLGTERVRLADVPALLRDLAPTWGPYRTLTGTQLRDQLDDAGVRTTRTGNVLRLDPADRRRVLAERDRAE
jgi:S-DNA-T family DNA segregation ATPase FtsK/SpoIIIE